MKQKKKNLEIKKICLTPAWHTKKNLCLTFNFRFCLQSLKKPWGLNVHTWDITVSKILWYMIHYTYYRGTRQCNAGTVSHGGINPIGQHTNDSVWTMFLCLEYCMASNVCQIVQISPFVFTFVFQNVVFLGSVCVSVCNFFVNKPTHQTISFGSFVLRWSPINHTAAR